MRLAPALARATLVIGLLALGAVIASAPAMALGPDNFSIPSSAEQLIVVSSPTY